MINKREQNKIKDEKVLYVGDIEIHEGDIELPCNTTWDEFYNYIVKLDQLTDLI